MSDHVWNCIFENPKANAGYFLVFVLILTQSKDHTTLGSTYCTLKSFVNMCPPCPMIKTRH